LHDMKKGPKNTKKDIDKDEAGIWEIGIVPEPMFGTKGPDGRPFNMVIVAHQLSYYILNSNIIASDTSEEKDVVQAFEKAITSGPMLPSIIHVKDARLVEYLRTIYYAYIGGTKPETKPLTPFVFFRFLKPFLAELKIDEKMLDRDLNVGFSGGEKRKIEILQMKLLDPKYIILDEIDSGLDVDAFATIANFLAKEKREDRCLIIITHNFRMAQFLPPDEVIILQKGEIIRK